MRVVSACALAGLLIPHRFSITGAKQENSRWYQYKENSMNPFGAMTVEEAYKLAFLLKDKQELKQRIRKRLAARRKAGTSVPSTKSIAALPIFMLFAVFGFCVLSVTAQSTFGSIRGTVQDATGAVIPGATVLIHSLDENFERQAISSDSGEFVFENIKAGHYRL